MNLVVDEAIKLKKLGLKIEDISLKLGIYSRTVLKYTKGIPHPNNVHALKLLPKLSKKLTVAYKRKIPKVKIVFLRAYCDGDAYVDLEDRYIELTSVNKKGLKDIQKLLESLKVDSNFHEYSKICRLIIRDILNLPILKR